MSSHSTFGSVSTGFKKRKLLKLIDDRLSQQVQPLAYDDTGLTTRVETLEFNTQNIGSIEVGEEEPGITEVSGNLYISNNVEVGSSITFGNLAAISVSNNDIKLAPYQSGKVRIGNLPTTEYSLPDTRGTLGQVLTVTATGTSFEDAPTTDLTTLNDKTQHLTAITTPAVSTFAGALTAQGNITIEDTVNTRSYTFPVLGPTVTNQTLLSTNATGALAWVSPSSIVHSRGGIVALPVVFAANVEVAVLPWMNVTTVPTGISNTAAGYTYNVGTVSPRLFYLDFRVNIGNDTKNDTEVTLYLRRGASEVSKTIFNVRQNQVAFPSLCAVSTISVGESLSIFCKTTTALTLQIYSPNTSMFMM
jgi:hypothetical protein